MTTPLEDGLLEYQRLPFRIPSFFRVAWSSDDAQQVWEPRVRQIASSFLSVQLAGIRHGIFQCTKAVLVSDRLEAVRAECDRYGFTYEMAGQLSPSLYHDGTRRPKAGELGQSLICIGARGDSQALAAAIACNDKTAEYALLGVPSCCASQQVAVWDVHRFQDFTWPMALNTVSARRDSPQVIEVRSAIELNPFWKWLGVRATWFSPCSMGCAGARRCAVALGEVAAASGYAAEWEWMREILSWPVEWSALHGIAEIRTPIVKMCMATDATPSKYTVRIRGTRYPHEAPTGLLFPFVDPRAM